jgi:hypothetical protein
MSIQKIPPEILFEQKSTYIGLTVGALLAAGISYADYREELKKRLKRKGLNPKNPEHKEAVKKIRKKVIKDLMPAHALRTTTYGTAGAFLGGAFGSSFSSPKKRLKKLTDKHMKEYMDAKERGDKQAMGFHKSMLQRIFITAKSNEHKMPGIRDTLQDVLNKYR